MTNDDVPLELSGYFERVSRFNSTTWGFALRYRGYLVRSYDMAKSHENPGEQGRIKGPHKHKFVSSKIDRYAYVPNPKISTKGPSTALKDFLVECNIELLDMFYEGFPIP